MEKKTPKSIKDVVESVVADSEEEVERIEEMVQLLVFELDKEEYATELIDVKEISKMQDITPVPNSPKFIKGIFNLRGRIVVVVDLEERFSLKRENPLTGGPEHIVIAEAGENIFGVTVDRVSGVLRIPVRIIKKVPSLVSARISRDYLKGIAVMDEIEQTVEGKKNQKKSKRLLILLDLPKILKEEELLKLGEGVRKASKV